MLVNGAVSVFSQALQYRTSTHSSAQAITQHSQAAVLTCTLCTCMHTKYSSYRTAQLAVAVTCGDMHTVYMLAHKVLELSHSATGGGSDM
jgi:hypothetical protein